MGNERIVLKFAVDIPVISLLCFILFWGQSLSDFLCILQNTHFVIACLISVVCTGCFVSALIERTSTPSISSVFGSFFLNIFGVVFFHFICVIYGAPFFSSVQETFYLSCLMTATTVLPCCCVLGPDMTSWYKVLCKNSPDTKAEMSVRMCVICSILGTWLGAFPIPLDWDRPWQVWPISCVYGTTLGYVLGLVLSHLQSYFQRSKLKIR